jgi:hypothetical protein
MKRYQNLFNGEFFEHNLGNGLKQIYMRIVFLSKIIYDDCFQRRTKFHQKTLKKR